MTWASPRQEPAFLLITGMADLRRSGGHADPTPPMCYVAEATPAPVVA